MAIILWALYPLSPWRPLYGLAHYLLDVLIRNIEDPRTVDWLCAYPDDPRGIPHFERAIDDLHASLDILIYARARELLGLKPIRLKRHTPSPPQRRRSRTFNELYARLRACGLRFSEIERLANRRAEKLKRLLAESEITLNAPAHATLIDSMHATFDRGICLHLSCGSWKDGSPHRRVSPKPAGVGGSAARAGSPAGILGARAPPWRSTDYCWLPTASEARF
jgi:hypothetical protein